jgi:hypothetical protein
MNYHDDIAAAKRFAESRKWWGRAALITWSIFVLMWAALLAPLWWPR